MTLSIQSLADGVRLHLNPLQGRVWSDEAELQAEVERILTARGGVVERERHLSARDRPDFMLPDEGLALEVKVDGSATDLLRQIHRYAGHDEVEGVIVLTTKSRHRSMPPEVNGVPVFVLWLRGI